MFSVVEIVCEIRIHLQNLGCRNLVIVLLILIYHNLLKASRRVLLNPLFHNVEKWPNIL